MILIITATINPPTQDYLKVNNTGERLSQYKESLNFFISSGAFQKIIFCDNSGYLISNDALKEERETASKKGITLEVLSFNGNHEKVKEQGKGYGEGEIMEYILKESKILSKEDYFFKVTGRLKVENIEIIVNKSKNAIKDGICLINVPNHTMHEIYDTRFYGMPVSMYERDFLKAYENVDDQDNIFFETVFTKIIREKNLRHRNFPLYPRITGKSGTSGGEYVYTEWKCRIKDIMSKLNYYGK